MNKLFTSFGSIIRTNNHLVKAILLVIGCAACSNISAGANDNASVAIFATPIAVENLPHHSPVVEQSDAAMQVLSGLDDIYTLCHQIDRKLTSVGFKQCLNMELQSSGAYSTKNKVIAFRDFRPAIGPIEGRVLLIGGIHGDEYSSVTIVFEWLKQLHENQGGQFEWRVVPLLNPDGLLMPPRLSQRMNANGVDLNRNFPTPNWHEEAMDYWVNRTRKSKRRYPGTAPLSEPESRWLSQQIDEFKPDAVISVHAPHGIVDFDGPQVPPDNLGPLELRLLGTYPGSMGRYIGVYKSIPLLTIELESAMRVPEDDDAERIWHDTIAWIKDRVVVPSSVEEKTLLSDVPDAAPSGDKPVAPVSELR